MAVELYANNASTTVAVGGYTSGSGVLNVASTAGNFPSVATSTTQIHLLVYRIIAGIITPIVNLVATNTASSTQWAVTAEGSDANALAGDTVICVLSSAGMNQIRADVVQFGTIANLPATTNQKQGNVYKCTDCEHEFIYNGSSWDAYFMGIPVTVPPTQSGFTNIGTMTVSDETNGILASSAVTSGEAHQWMEKSLPSTPYSFEAGFQLNMSEAAKVFIGWRDHSTNREVLFGIATTNASDAAAYTYSFYAKYTNATTFSANYDTSGYPIVLFGEGLVWLKLKDDGTNFSVYYRVGLNSAWVQFGTNHTRTDFLATPDRVGFGIVNFTSHGNLYAKLIHWKQGTS